ncbi:hypothetical protein [Persephonella sp.]
MVIIKYKDYFDKIKQEYQVVAEDESGLWLQAEDGVFRLPKPLDKTRRLEKLMEIGFPVDVVQNIQEGLKGAENIEKLKSLFKHTAKEYLKTKNWKEAVRRGKIAIEGMAGTGKTTLTAAYINLLWQYLPSISALYMTPFDFQLSEEQLEEKWNSADIIIVDNFDAVRASKDGEYLDLDFDTKRRLQRFLFKGFDEGKGLIFVSNDDLQKALVMLGGEPLLDRFNLYIRFKGKKSLRSGNVYMLKQPSGGKNIALGR